MTKFNRRDLLRSGAAGALFAALGRSGSAASPLWQPKTGGVGLSPQAPRLLTIFLRGAQDAVYTVPPVGDATYNTTSRQTLRPQTVQLPGQTYAELNTAYSLLLPIWNTGHAAFMHQVGNPTGGRSHFVEMAIYESADVPTGLFAPRKDGVLARMRSVGAFGASQGPVFGASVSNRMQQFFRGFSADELMAHVVSLSQFHVGSDPINDRMRASLALHLGQDPDPPLEQFLDATGEYIALNETPISSLSNYIHDAAAFPRNLAETQAVGLPDDHRGQAFLRQCEEAHQLLKSNVGCQVAGVEFGSWDTHSNQIMERDLLDPYLAKAIRSLYDAAMADNLTNYVILVVSEFGRTNFENANGGTDHGVGGLMMAFGKPVRGGVYNCHGGSGLGKPWRELGVSPNSHATYPNACPVVTDFREIYAELFEVLFGLSSNQIGTLIPNWASNNRMGFLV